MRSSLHSVSTSPTCTAPEGIRGRLEGARSSLAAVRSPSATVHRDLKPANIKIKDGRLEPALASSDVGDGIVKVLDFGLAKALAPAAALAGNPAQSPTLTVQAMTEVGMILGTAAYMAPEQARGRLVDRRADVWAFGSTRC